jgi:threonylcarbamoyladenosine tRNA methylthiotransferase MtaB
VKVYFHTFGCKANQYDTELVRQAFADQDVTSVADPAEADLAVVNTCTVTATAEAKMRSLVRRLARGNRRLETVIIGCAAAVDDGTLTALPSVRAVVGGASPDAVLRAAGACQVTPSPILRRFDRGGRAWLKIQDGCDEHCTFCATTLARGDNRSRPVAEIVAEAQALAEHHEEIVLTGVHIGTFGTDRETRNVNRETRSLGALVEVLVRDVPRVRFRLSSVEATEVDDRLADVMIGSPDRLAPHLHAPLQSGSDRILKRMGRHWYTARTYRTRLEWLAARLPVFGLGADVMAGFPGESDADHRATVDLIAGLPFTYLHVFPFSLRPGTAAGRLSGAVASPAATERAREIRALGESKAHAHRARRTGSVGDGVVVGRSKGKTEVLTEDYLSVYLSSDEWDGRPPPRFPVTIN